MRDFKNMESRWIRQMLSQEMEINSSIGKGLKTYAIENGVVK